MQLIPNVPVSPATPEMMRVYRSLKQLREGEYVVWQRLPLHARPAPDFLVLGESNRALVIAVSSATRQQVLKLKQPGLFDDDSERETMVWQLIGGAKEAVSRLFDEVDDGQFDDYGGVDKLVPMVIAFPNLRSKDLRSVIQPYLGDAIGWMAKDHLTPRRFEGALKGYFGLPLPEQVMKVVRKTFTPEAVIPADFTVRQPVERNTEAQLTDYLLDYDQEWAMKVDLRLPDGGDIDEADLRLRLVSGVAGSGKSLLVIYRAHLLRRLSPDSRILVLSHNGPLVHDLRRRYERLNGRPGPDVLISKFLKWCSDNWPQSEPWPTVMGMKEREVVARQIWREYLSDTTISEQQLLDEIDWFKDRLLSSREDYLNADRKGRGFGADESRRNLLFDAMVAYNNELRRMGRMDWADIPRRMWRFIEDGRVEIGSYDAILVDEAQFFAPMWFEIIKRLLKPGTGQLYLVADPMQGFLKRGQSWLASGLDVRGKSLRLNRSYRTTREILGFASLFYRTRLPSDEDDVETPNFVDMPTGAFPVIVPLTAKQDEITRVVNEIMCLVRQGVPLRDILVIHADWRGTERLIRRLNQSIGPGTAIDAKSGTGDYSIRVSTLNASTGLESPVVFLTGIHELYEREQSLRIADDERAELIRDNTRKIYMAITRAGQRLLITYVGDIPGELIQAVDAVANFESFTVRRSTCRPTSM